LPPFGVRIHGLLQRLKSLVVAGLLFLSQTLAGAPAQASLLLTLSTCQRLARWQQWRFLQFH
jgi:hypothetical protein